MSNEVTEQRPEPASQPTQDSPERLNHEARWEAERASDLAALATVPRAPRSWSGQDRLPAPGELPFVRVARAKDLGYLLQIEELPQWGPSPCSECPPGSPPLSREGHDAAHEWCQLCCEAHHPFLMITIYHAPSTTLRAFAGFYAGKRRSGSTVGSNGAILLDLTPMENEATGAGALIDATFVGARLRQMGIKATVEQIGPQRLRVDVAASHAVFVGLKVADMAHRLV